MSETGTLYGNQTLEPGDIAAITMLKQIAEKVLSTAPSTIAMLRQTPDCIGRLEEELAEFEAEKAKYVHDRVEADKEDLELTLADAAFMAGDDVLSGKNAETRKIQMDYYLANHGEVNKAKRNMALSESELIQREAQIGYVKAKLIEQRESMRGALAAANLQASMSNLLSSLLAATGETWETDIENEEEEIPF